MPYNLTSGTGALTDKTDIFGFFQWMNSASGGFFSYLLLLTIFVIAYIYSSRYDSQDAFMTASFGTFMIGVLLSVIGLLDGAIVVMLLIMVAISVVLRR